MLKTLNHVTKLKTITVTKLIYKCMLFLDWRAKREPGFVWVLENLESPGILLWHFPGLESSGKRPLVLESSGNLLNSAKKISSVWKVVRRINIEILGL